MNKKPFLSLLVATSVLVASTFVVAAGRQEPAQDQPAQDQQQSGDMPDGPGLAQFKAVCSSCHDAVRIVAMRRTRAEWQDVLLKMIQEGATGGEKDFEAIHAYLTLNFGKVYINSARADEIMMATGLSKKDADALVDYRTKNGNFTDLDGCKKVPDVD